jgi:3-oxoacid CoA-transferase subunit A
MGSAKHHPTPQAALDGVLFDGMTIMAGGFGVTGVPERLIEAVAASGVRGLTIISNNCGASGHGLWNLLNNGQIDRLICSFIGDNVLLAEKHLAGTIQVEMTPQGTLAERIRAGGAGIPAFYTRTGVGTLAAEGKPVEAFDGIDYVRERWLRADLSLVKAWRGDAEGNLIYAKTARNFNPDMATAGRITIAEVEEMEPVGALDPDAIHTPGIFVDRIIQGAFYSRAIASRVVREAAGAAG